MFGNILKLEKYIQVADLAYQGWERQYFQWQIVDIEVTDVLINKNIRFVPSKRNVRRNGVNLKMYTATYGQNINDDMMEIDFHRYPLETHRKFENQEEDLLKSQAQLKSLEGQSSIDVLKTDLKEISFNNERGLLNYQKKIGSKQHNKRKQKMQDYY